MSISEKGDQPVQTSSPPIKQQAPVEKSPVDVHLPKSQQQISPVLEDVLTYPNPPSKPQRSGGTASMPKHLSSEQVVQYLEERRQRKLQEEEDKRKRKADREMKRKKRELEKERKQMERQARGRGRGIRRGRGRGRGKERASVLPRSSSSESDVGSPVPVSNPGRSQKSKESIEPRTATSRRCRAALVPIQASSNPSSSGEQDREDSLVPCCMCLSTADAVWPWVACDYCEQWYHAECTDIDPELYPTLDTIDWVCNNCL